MIYARRIKIFVIVITFLLLVCLLRLIQMQLLKHSFYQDKIAELKLERGRLRPLKTIRGKILDRKGRVLATDGLQFHLCIDYELSSLLDERVQRAKSLRAAKKENPDTIAAAVQKELETKLKELQQIIDKCTYFGFPRSRIENKIRNINDSLWNLRTYLAWKRSFPDREFAQAVPDANDRLLLTAAVDIAEVHKSWPLLELKTDYDIFAAQLEFMNVDGIQILPTAHRLYPYGTVAAQTIGWVGRPQKNDKELFAQDRLSSYLDDEVCGREDGVEYVCETILRGRRGEEVYDIDRELVNRVETQFGEDVSLTLDIELQKRIENYLANCDYNPNCKAPTAAVVIDVASGDILAFVSMPVFDLNRVRYDYDSFVNDPNEPLRNRAINKQYPPGSVVKPLILIAGIEAGKITPHEIISCPAQKAPTGWPSCWIYNKYPWMGHDDKGQNNARNAIKGSCNIYFSRLAERIDTSVLQQWLFNFGYGHKSLLVSRDLSLERVRDVVRDFRQARGQISSSIPKSTISHFEQVPPLRSNERRFFGIGQGNLRATPLQVANAMAAIARGGILKQPRLFLPFVIASAPSVIASAAKQSQADVEKTRQTNHEPQATSHEINLNISPQTLFVIHDGMSAVVSKPGGTAYKEFAPVLTSLAEQGVMVYGKTGSTEKPDNAWFAGFATDSAGRSIAIAVLIEGGQHGSADAAPLARDIIQFCIEEGYIGQSLSKIIQEFDTTGSF